MRANGLLGAAHEPDVAEKRREKRARGVRDAQVRDERLAGSALRRHRNGSGLAEDHGSPALGAPLRERRGSERAGIGGARHDEGGKIVAKQALDQRLGCLVGVDKVC